MFIEDQKTEGTSDTYGQNIEAEGESQDGVTDGSSPAVVSAGTPVTVRQTLDTVYSDQDRSRIILAAAAKDGEPVEVEDPGTNLIKVDVGVIVKESFVKSPEEIRKSLEAAQKVDLLVTYKSAKSESLEWNSLKVPNLRAKNVYNFFVDEESNVVVQESIVRDPLIDARPSKTPRFVDLKWDSVALTQPPAAAKDEMKKNKGSRKTYFTVKKGVSSVTSFNFKNSYAAIQKTLSSLKVDGIDKTLVDTHNLDVAFQHLANDNMFANGVVASVVSKTNRNPPTLAVAQDDTDI